MIKALSISVTAITLLLSQQSLAEGFYIGGKYHGQFLNNTGSLKVTSSSGKDITVANINDRVGEKTEGQSISDYKPNYNPPLSASIVLGGVKQLEQHECRFELEGMYSRVKVGNIGLINGPITVMYNMKDKDGQDGKDATYSMIANHNQIENSSIMANVYHHWKNDQFSFSPYVGVGIGGTRIKMFEKTSIRPAYQLKAGLNYQITKDTDIYIGYRHFGVIGGNFDEFATSKKTEVPAKDGRPKTVVFEKDNSITTNLKNSFFGTHGVEVGMTVRFAS